MYRPKSAPIISRIAPPSRGRADTSWARHARISAVISAGMFPRTPPVTFFAMRPAGSALKPSVAVTSAGC